MAEKNISFSAKSYLYLVGGIIMGYIYKISNDINKKVYIGKTVKSIEQRWQEHCRDYLKRKNEQRPLYRAMNKYGISHFYIEEIEEINDLEKLSQREVYWIEFYHSYSNGYNATLGGDGKILYDYNFIIEQYNKGKTGKEIAKDLNCDCSVISHALKNSGIDTQKNAALKKRKRVKGIFPSGEERIFVSLIEAANFLIQNQYTTSTNNKGVSVNIGRVARGENNRKSYLGIKWFFI